MSSCVSPHISKDVGLVKGLEVNGLDEDGRDESSEMYEPTDPEDEEHVKDEDELFGEQDEGKDNEEDFIGRDEAPEEAPLKRPNNPSDPTPQEREEHNAKHLPYRPWCPVCVKAKGREDPHYEKTAKERNDGLPKMCIDYAETGENEDMSDSREMIVGKEKWTQWICAHLVKCKGLGD